MKKCRNLLIDRRVIYVYNSVNLIGVVVFIKVRTVLIKQQNNKENPVATSNSDKFKKIKNFFKLF